jgi:hypothetical protein
LKLIEPLASIGAGKYVEKSKVTAGKELDQDQESECAGGYQGC